MRSPTDVEDKSPSQPPQIVRHYLEPEELNVIPLWLTPIHIVAAIFQYMQSFVLFAFSREVAQRAPLYTNFRTNFDLMDRDNFGMIESKQSGSNSLTIFSALTCLGAAIAHTVTVLPGIRQRYEYLLRRNQSPYRWFQYMFTASLMRVQVAQIAGVTDVHLLFCIFCLTATNILFGCSHEPMNARALRGNYKQHYLGLYLAFVPHMATWSIIFCYFIVGVTRLDDPPGYSLSILGALFFFDLTFAINFLCQWHQLGYYKDYIFGEFAFIMLSFTAKTFMAWIRFGAASSTRLQE